MGEQINFLCKEDYDAMDGVPPILKDRPTTNIRTDYEVRPGDLLQWFIHRRGLPKEHQWYRILDVKEVAAAKRSTLGSRRYDLLVEPVATPSQEEIDAARTGLALPMTEEEQ